MYGLLRASELSVQLGWIFPCWFRFDSSRVDSEYVLAPYRLDCRPLICINQLVHSCIPSGGLSLSLNKPHYHLHWYSPLFLSLSAAYLNTGIVLMSQGRLEEAKRTFVTCADIPDENLKDPHAHKSSVTSCLYNLGKLLHEQGHQEVRRCLAQPLDFNSVHTKSDVMNLYESQFSHHNFSDQCFKIWSVQFRIGFPGNV